MSGYTSVRKSRQIGIGDGDTLHCVGKVAKAVLSIAVVFNVAGLNPQFSSESYARTVAAMPKTVTVTEKVQLKQAGKADLNGRELSPAASKVVNWIGAQNRPSEVSLVLDPTLEYQRLGAVKGVILNADGSTMYDLFSEFGDRKSVV